MDTELKSQALSMINGATSLIKQGWIQGEYARTNTNKPCLTTDPEASRFCLSGALMRMIANRNLSVGDYVQNIIDKVLSDRFRESRLMSRWNDDPERTQHDVIDLLTEAKTLIEKEAV